MVLDQEKCTISTTQFLFQFFVVLFQGSGKTYTMGTGNCVYLDEEERGIIPRAVTDIFDQIAVILCFLFQIRRFSDHIFKN